MPDDHSGFVELEWLSMGQLLSIPMILIGTGLVWYAYKKAA
jgi:phosphatidylglycerol:prolipoprotein diacylglycerol transferase